MRGLCRHGMAEQQRAVLQPGRACHVEEGLVDAVLLDGVRVLLENLDHRPARVAVERVVGRDDDELRNRAEVERAAEMVDPIARLPAEKCRIYIDMKDNPFHKPPHCLNCYIFPSEDAWKSIRNA